MENATQALLIAAGMLMGIMILSLGVTLFSEFSSYVQTSHDEIRFNELNSFNRQFLKYYGRNNLTIHDVITVANIANENNSSYNLTTDEAVDASRGNEEIFYVEVILQSGGSETSIERGMDMVELLTEHTDSIFSCIDNGDELGVEISEETGRVYRITFRKN